MRQLPIYLSVYFSEQRSSVFADEPLSTEAEQFEFGGKHSEKKSYDNVYTTCIMRRLILCRMHQKMKKHFRQQ